MLTFGRNAERGDTIIEVIIVLAVLGLAIGVSYATANRSLMNARQAQENARASTIAQSQIEALLTLKSKPLGDPDYVFIASSFCVYSTGSPLQYKVKQIPPPPAAVPAECQVDQIPYNVSINYDASQQDLFTILVSWPDVRGDGTDTVTLNYRMHP